MPKTKNLSQELWDDIKEQWEAGAKPADLAKKYDIHVNSIHIKKRTEGWVREEEPSDDELAELKARLAEAEARAVEAESFAVENAPTVYVPAYETVDDVIAHVGEAALREEAENALASENVKRFKKGLPPLPIEDSPEMEATIRRLTRERLEAQTKHVSEVYKMRVMKMVKPNGNVVQVPVEPQINNEVAQSGTALAKARAKGFKPAEPYRCQAYNCWLPAATDESGVLSLDGYCSTQHRSYDPIIGSQAVSGVTTTGRGVGG